MQIPIRAYRRDKQVAKHCRRGNGLGPFAHRQHVGSENVGRFHHHVRHEKPKHAPPKSGRRLADAGKIAGNQEKAGSLVHAYHFFHVREMLLDVHQVHGDHRQDKHALQEIQFFNPLAGHRLCFESRQYCSFSLGKSPLFTSETYRPMASVITVCRSA